VHQEKINALAKTLSQARVNAKPIEQLSKDHQLNITDAYAIQEEGIRFRQENGEVTVGMKMGLTSAAKRKQMNLESPLYGVLTDKMQVANDGVISLNGQIHPKIEPEIAFFIAKDLKGKVSEEEVLAACSGVCVALEVLDSRYTQFKYFSMEDVISDNSSSSMFILGEKISDFKNINLSDLQMKMKINGELVQEGNSNAISGNPVLSVVQLCELLAEREQYLRRGQVVLAGAATAAVALEKGMTITLEVQDLSNLPVSVTVGEQ